jgi:hypothetical protein
MPFDGDSFAEICAKILHDPIPSLCASDPSLPPSLDAWWYRAMARDPNQRYQSAKEFADGFAEAIGCAPASTPSVALRGEAPRDPGVPPARLQRRSVSRRQWWQMLALLCLGLAMAVGLHTPGASTGGALAADTDLVPSGSELTRASANTVVLMPEAPDGLLVLDSIQQSLSAQTGVPAIGTTEVPGGIRLRCNILSGRAAAPQQLSASSAVRQ